MESENVENAQPASVDDAPDIEEVQHLTPDMGGVWEVSTRYGTTHIWDLDAGTYMRQPAQGGGPMFGDRVPHVMTSVVAWPRVGEHSHVVFDDPDAPQLVEHFRRSSTITSIRRLHPSPDDAGGHNDVSRAEKA